MSVCKIAVYGAGGRMGRRVIKCAAERHDVRVVCTIDESEITGDLSTCDVIVDFSVAKATDAVLELVGKNSIPLVTGVTGRSKKQLEDIAEASEIQPIFSAANFSIGVAVLNKLVEAAVRSLGREFDAEIFEIHHRMKADAPSGTALLLGKTAAESRGLDWPDARRNRDGITGPRSENEVGTAALRGGAVPGEHTVFLFGESERLELTHRAANRDIFALGAIRAAIWLKDQQPGLYGMKHLVDSSDETSIFRGT
ncbi:MAG: 4-hydroxy-tetrahydrodipicolinate reductase [Myxococcota bacterium]|jgi:4-hydroxy-tetrahydrodipicolinate reductase|nr:4-hydroxy-tetrahydrodipicolinate reductase [Myxococcota bacterium]